MIDGLAPLFLLLPNPLASSLENSRICDCVVFVHYSFLSSSPYSVAQVSARISSLDRGGLITYRPQPISQFHDIPRNDPVSSRSHSAATESQLFTALFQLHFLYSRFFLFFSCRILYPVLMTRGSLRAVRSLHHRSYYRLISTLPSGFTKLPI